MNPADAYVEDFLRDIPKSHVLTLDVIARPLRPGETASGVTLSGSTIIRDATRAIIGAHGPVHVVDDGREIGVVSSEDVLALIAGEHSPEMGD